MGRMRWRLKASKFLLAAGLPAALILAAGAAQAGELSLTARVDKQTVNLGEAFTLILSLSGDLEGAALPPVELPDGLAVAASTEENSLVFSAGKPTRTIHYSFVIIAQRPGGYRLGPFAVRVKDQNHPTEAIDITVVKPAVPPRLSNIGRVTL